MTTEERIWLLIARSVAGELSPEETRELDHILLTEPEWKAQHDSLTRLRADTPVAPSIEERNALARGLQKLDHSLANEGRSMERHIFNNEPKPLSRGNSKWWMIAASMLVLFLAAGIFSIERSKTPALVTQQQIVARYGKRVRSVLPDGSVVWLNSGSSIRYAKNLLANGKREVTLNGEAYFDVKHDPKHAFIVHAGKLNVVVLGTAFNVKAYDGEAYMETTLIRGKVEILNTNKPGANIILYPNEKVTVSNKEDISWKSKLKVKAPRTDSLAGRSNTLALPAPLPNEEITETAWVNDKLSFKKTDMYELGRQLERWYNVKITFDNDHYAAMRFTGTFKDQDITEVIRALQLTEPFNYSIKDNQIHIW